MYARITPREAISILNRGGKKYLMVAHDLECNAPLGNTLISKDESEVIAKNSKTIILNGDVKEDDSYSMIYFYSDNQEDILHINPIGLQFIIFLTGMAKH